MQAIAGSGALAWPIARSGSLLAADPGPAAVVPGDVASWFQPPSELAKEFGVYRSPLLFADGRPVQTAADWRKRREEIRRRWDEVMGAWPPLLASPIIEVGERKTREDFTQARVQVDIAPNQKVDGYLLIPNGAPKFPAVFVPFYDSETSIGLGKGGRDFAYQLCKRGFVTLSIGSPGGDARKPGLGEADCQPLSFLGYVAANCANALANLPEVDANRIGIVGHSYGGKWAMFGSCLYERFACAAWSDPGIVFDEERPNVNYWEPWYLGFEKDVARKPGVVTASNPRSGAYKKMVEERMDLHELHALMAPRPFLVSGGSEDPPERWVALNHSVAVNRLLGFEQRVAMTNRAGHDPDPESNEQIYRFFEFFLGSATNGRARKE